MDTGTYEFSALKSKYSGFLHPFAEIHVEGTKLPVKYIIFDIIIENTIHSDSVSAAVFRLRNSENEYKNPEEFSILTDFPLLKKVEIKTGYGGKLKTVFTGYIFERNLSIGGGDTPELAVTCLCCKAFLRLNTECKTHKEKAKLSQVVSAVLEKYSFSKEVAETEAFAKKMTITQSGATDFIYIRRIADRLGYEFFSNEDKIYFRKPMSISGNIIKLEAENIFHLEYKSSMTNIISKAELYGYNQHNSVAETALADSVSKKIGKGKTGAELMGNFSAAHTSFLYQNDKSGAKLTDMAKVYLQAKSMELAGLNIITPGLPEIIPGRFMSIDKLGKDLDNTYYIQSVKHIMRENYYVTEIKCISNTVPN